jgi:excisionase family DNA binding protein
MTLTANTRRFYRVKEVSEMTGLPLCGVYWLITKGQIPARKVGGTVLVPSSWLDSAAGDQAGRWIRPRNRQLARHWPFTGHAGRKRGL